MNTNEEIKQLFKLYLEGNTNPLQEERLFALLQKQGMSTSALEEGTMEMWNDDVPLRDSSLAAQAELQSVWQKIAEEEPEKKMNTSWLKYAASLLIVCATALGWYTLKIKEPELSQESSMLTKTTNSGERLKLLLPDSSVVYLNAMSKLSFPTHFNKGEHREIYLEGEAFFEVKKDVSRPFIVHSGNLQTQVLGTSFNVDAYPGSDIFSITVRTGKVGVSTRNGGGRKHLSFLTPGKQLVYQQKTEKYSLNELPLAEIDSWRENRFIFRNEELETIISRLERSYPVSFKLKNPALLKCRFNATFSNQNIRQIMEQLHIMTAGKIHYKFNAEKTTITLWGEACE
ncbi:FecR family protein [Pedobacter gandavensis]|uniref:FecR family protein n=1 Tax=Pedobacter gandavensis TaxID=2679963 RepID=UPI00292FFA07|nr:FecR domain-containing protein [Pedobacter gandavensis]